MNYGQHFQTKETPQSQPIPGSVQVANSAGGYSFAVDDWVRLDRFLILGAEGGSYYASEQKLTIENARAVMRCLLADGVRAVKRIAEISEAGRAPKNDPAIFALAMAAGSKNPGASQAALDALPRVCRTGTHLFQFCEAVQGFRGWGRALRSAVGSWYSAKDVDALAYQLVKYQQRNGWSHRDLLRLSHPVSHAVPKPSSAHVSLLGWCVGKEVSGELPRVIQGFIQIQKAVNAKDAVRILNDYPLPWEAIPTEHLGSADVWAALLPTLPMTALIRNLARMTANGLLAPTSEAVQIVKTKLTDEAALRKARVHPVSVLAGLLTYQAGHGLKGKLQWSSVREIVDALDQAFYLSFGNVEPSGKRLVLAMDVSGSMCCGIVAGVQGLTPRIASGAMAMLTARTESEWTSVAFTSTGSGYGGQWGGGDPGLMPLAISPRQRLDDVCAAMARLPMGGTDCALPMLWALKNNVKADAFVIYTDSETWHGKIHPVQALQKYRDTMGIGAKLIVVGMVSNGFSIADPNDGGMLDVVGFDTATPNLITDFVKY